MEQVGKQEPLGTSPPKEDLLDRLIRMAVEDAPPPTPTTVTPRPDMGGLLENPALLQALPQLMSSLGPLLSSGKATTSAKKSSLDKHTALLCALKPYLGRERQQALEQMISVCRVMTTLEGMGISLPDLWAGLTAGRGELPQREEGGDV